MLNEKYEPRIGVIVEAKDNKNVKIACESCFSIPDVLYYCHFKDVDKRKRIYFRYECFNCCEKIFKQDGYYNQFVDLLYIRSVENFPALCDERNIFFLGTYNFYYITSDLTIPYKLLYG
jgi:hypothetical protein